MTAKRVCKAIPKEMLLLVGKPLIQHALEDHFDINGDLNRLLREPWTAACRPEPPFPRTSPHDRLAA